MIDTADYDLWALHFGEECTAMAPGAFNITGPVGIQAQKPNTITWDAAPGATSYRFALSQQPDVSAPL